MEEIPESILVLADELRSVYLGSDKTIETPIPKREEWIRLAKHVDDLMDNACLAGRYIRSQ